MFVHDNKINVCAIATLNILDMYLPPNVQMEI